MAALFKTHKFSSLEEMNNFFAGGIRGSNAFSKGQENGPAGFNNIVGKTLSLSNPVGSVTFVAGAYGNGFLLFKEVKEQIEAAIPAVLCRQAGGCLTLIEVTPSTGVVLLGGSPGGYATMKGTVDLNTLAFGAGGDLDTFTLHLEIDGVAKPLITFAAPVNSGDVLTQILASISPAATAYLAPDGHLVIRSATTGALSKVKVLASTAATMLGLTAGSSITGAATNTANTVLGFDATHGATGHVYGTSGSYVFSEAYATNDTTHLVITYEG